MPKKKSVKRSAEKFLTETENVRRFVEGASFREAPDTFESWTHDLAVIRAYAAFENLMLDALVGAVNNNTETISSILGVKFPRHLTDKVCEYLVTGGDYFDFKGRDGLIKLVRKFVPRDHYLLRITRNKSYRDSLDRLSSMRNFAAHRSEQAKAAALKAANQERMSSAGAWLKKHNRLGHMLDDLERLAEELKQEAPY